MRTLTIVCLLCLTTGPIAWGQEPEGVEAVTKAAAEELKIELAENLILNPSFEKELQDWQKGEQAAGIEVARDDQCASEGSYSLRLTSKTGQSVTCRLWEGPVEPNRRHRFEAKYATSTLGADVEVSPALLVWIEFEGEGQKAGAQTEFIGSHLADDWETLTGEFTTPPEASTASVDLWIWQQAGTVWFDEVKLGPLVQGERPLVTAPDGNLLFNGDMELGAAGQPAGWEGGGLRRGIYNQWLKYDKQALHIWSDEKPHSGKRSVCCEVKDKSKVPYIYWCQDVTLKPNTTYEFSGWLRCEGDTAVHLQVYVQPERGLQVEKHGTNYVHRGAWRRVTHTFKTPEWDDRSRDAHAAIVGGKVGKCFADDIRLEAMGGKLEGVTVQVTSDSPGNVFVSAKDVKLNVKITNHTIEDMTLTGYYAVAGGKGPKAPPKEFLEPTSVEAGASIEKELTGIVTKPGVYKLKITIRSAGNDELSKEFQFAAAQ